MGNTATPSSSQWPVLHRGVHLDWDPAQPHSDNRKEKRAGEGLAWVLEGYALKSFLVTLAGHRPHG
jgi:hypothetical protein